MRAVTTRSHYLMMMNIFLLTNVHLPRDTHVQKPQIDSAIKPGCYNTLQSHMTIMSYSIRLREKTLVIAMTEL